MVIELSGLRILVLAIGGCRRSLVRFIGSAGLMGGDCGDVFLLLTPGSVLGYPTFRYTVSFYNHQEHRPGIRPDDRCADLPQGQGGNACKRWRPA
jgi:hypothetical protein